MSWDNLNKFQKLCWIAFIYIGLIVTAIVYISTIAGIYQALTT